MPWLRGIRRARVLTFKQRVDAQERSSSRCKNKLKRGRTSEPILAHCS